MRNMLTWRTSTRGGGLGEPVEVELDNRELTFVTSLANEVATLPVGIERTNRVVELRTMMDLLALLPGTVIEWEEAPTMTEATDLFNEEMTVREAKAILRQLVNDGHECPVCTQLAKVYQRKLHATMAATAIKLYRAGGDREFIHTPSLPGDTHEASQLAWWGLAVEELAFRPDDGRAGFWKLTEHGVAFVRGQATIPKYARVYDHRCLSTVGDPTTIREALGDRFDYGELMGADEQQELAA